MAATTLTFASYSPERFTALQSALASKGLRLDSTFGQVKEFGADVFYTYRDNTLTLTVSNPPHFHSMESFCAELTKEINAVQ